MCLEFASCFGGRTDDYGGERPNRKEEHGGVRRGRDRRGNHGSTYNGHAADHKLAPQAAYHHQPPAAVDEAGHKAYHDGRGGYAAYGQHKTNIDALKLPAWQNKVGDGAYTGRLQEDSAAADHMNNAARDYHHYPTSTTTTTTALGRY
ncbi:unnamed protein product [Triticum turgidum subsp. durum]|uniref:Uncharacterized protein n=1 Tax=Triticum turgidum subsp. durum TaxID=4567 RepID=A0A9R1Q8C9_TRITD|nr:unnamed protein product [Triticum turgidum subsp. durum]